MLNVSKYEAQIIKNTLNSQGYIIIDNFLDNDILQKIKDFTKYKIETFNQDKFSLSEDGLKDSVIQDLRQSNSFNNFFKFLLPDYSIKKMKDVHYLLNYSSKLSKKNTKLHYHFDAFLITMIIPINLIENESKEIATRISILPNIRKENKSFAFNLIYKIFFQNKLFILFSNSFLFKIFFKPHDIKIQNNQILIFNGFRSLHSAKITKNNIQKERTRLIFHVHNPFINNKIDKLIFNRIKKNRRKKIKR